MSTERANCFACAVGSKTAAMRDERVGEERREGRPATELAEASESCRRIPPRAQMKGNKKLKFWLVVVITVAAVIYLGLEISSQSRISNREFKGPVGSPHMKGPSGPPPGGN